MKIKKKQGKELQEWAAAIAEASGRKVEEVMKELTTALKEILKKPVLKDFDDEAKVEHAIRMLKATHTQPLTRSGREFEIFILDYTKPRKITPKDKSKEPYTRADIFGLAVATGDDATDKEKELAYAQMVLFDENTKLVNEVERGITYKTNASGKLVKKVWELSAIEGSTRFKEADEQLEANPEDVLMDMFKLVPIADAEYNVTNPKVRSDLRLIRGDVTYAAVKTSDSGYSYGRYVVIDDSLDIEDIKKTGGLSVMVDKSQVLYAEGSAILLLGQIEKDEEYGVGMSAHVVVPIIPIPREQVEDVEELPEDDESYDDDDDLALGGDEEEQPDEEEDEPESDGEEEEKPKPEKKPKKDSKKPAKKPAKKEEDDDDDDGGFINLDEDDD